MWDYAHGERAEKFWVNNIQGERFAYDIARYFRSAAEFSAQELALISQAHGKILDVGCATGYYIPALMKQGSVIGIDISEPMIRVAHEHGLDNCLVQDFTSYSPGQRFDTISFFEYTMGFTGSYNGVVQTIEHSLDLLAPGGQILGIWENIPTSQEVSQAFFEYKGNRTESIQWIGFSPKGLNSMCTQLGLQCEILNQNQDEYAYRIFDKS